MKLLFTGDLVISRDFDSEALMAEDLKKLFLSADYNIVNLEAPVTEHNVKILKTGPHLKSHKQSTYTFLKALNINIAALANNHIRDYGSEGVLDTISFCRDNDILPIGAGSDIAEAAVTNSINTSQGSIALINIAENEWASAEIDSAGANGMDVIKDTNKIQEAKKMYDFVFVIVHGGHEYYSLPSPRMKDQYRYYIDQGADCIVGHHTHCVSGTELYNGKPIFYSLGNFLFTENSKMEEWYKGLILEVDINEGEIKTQIHPVKQSKDSFKLNLMCGDEKATYKAHVEHLSGIITHKEKLREEWTRFVSSRQSLYESYWSPKVFIKNKYFKYLLKKVPFVNTYGLSYLSNLIRCESHLDLSRSIIKERLNK